MFRRVLSIFFLLLYLTSCDYASQNTSTKKSNLQVLDTIIDFTRVDVYPIFSDCENFSENDNQKNCFEITLTQKLSSSLHENNLKVNERVNDTSLIDILIDKTGKASVVRINSPMSILTQLPALDTIIRQSIAKLPTIKPAVKRGIFVNSQYRLAVIVKTL